MVYKRYLAGNFVLKIIALDAQNPYTVQYVNLDEEKLRQNPVRETTRKYCARVQQSLGMRRHVLCACRLRPKQMEELARRFL